MRFERNTPACEYHGSEIIFPPEMVATYSQTFEMHEKWSFSLPFFKNQVAHRKCQELCPDIVFSIPLLSCNKLIIHETGQSSTNQTE